MLAAVAGVVGAGAVLGVLDPGSGAERQSVASSGAAAPEPRLDDVKRNAPAPKGERRRRGRGPGGTVVEVRRPGGEVSEGEVGDAEVREGEASQAEDPPKRVLEENAKLRRELDHLKALEAERRRVSRALIQAAAVYDGPVRLGPGGLAWPVGGAVVSPFGQRWGRLHAGIDIAARAGTVIHAAERGLVVIAGPTGGYGNYVCVQHTRRLTTCYAHLSRFLTERGDVVRQGDPLGLVGCTGHCFGDHLHFETWVGGRPVDPMRYF